MNKHDVFFAWAGGLLSILFFISINYITTPNHIWFYYPVFALIMWPVSMQFIYKKAFKTHALISSVIIILFFVTTNYMETTNHPWFLYASYPVLCWPILMYLGKKAKTFSISIIGSAITILYYSVLNLIISPQHPWAIYITFAVLWWPLVMFFIPTKKYHFFSVFGSLLTIVFFITVNIVTTPNEIWAIYPIFAVLWWPLSSIYYYKSKSLRKVY